MDSSGCHFLGSAVDFVLISHTEDHGAVVITSALYFDMFSALNSAG
jgi:hypothetical protein